MTISAHLHYNVSCYIYQIQCEQSQMFRSNEYNQPTGVYYILGATLV